MITWKNVRKTVREAAQKAGLMHISEIEVLFFLRSLRLGMKQAVINYSVDYGTSCSIFQTQADFFDFTEHPRFEIVKQAKECTRLPSVVCEQMLDALDTLISLEFELSNSVLLEKIGAFERHGDTYTLILDKELIALK